MKQKHLRFVTTVLAVVLLLPACGKRTTVNLSELETRPVETAGAEETALPKPTVLPTEEVTVPETTAETTLPELEETTAAPETTEAAPQPQGKAYILNINSKKIHVPGCSSVQKMKESNKKPVTAVMEELLAQGYVPCKICKPQ